VDCGELRNGNQYAAGPNVGGATVAPPKTTAVIATERRVVYSLKMRFAGKWSIKAIHVSHCL
jgi:hypothetical protein